MSDFDAIVVLSFGGPESLDDVMPFLERVTAGRGVPTERLMEVFEQYKQTGGKSPINEQMGSLVELIEKQLRNDGIDLPVYWGNRNWHPLIEVTVTQMAQDGIRNALCFATSAYSSYPGCRQYREDIERGRNAAIDAGYNAPQITKLRQFFNHPGMIEPMVDNVRAALNELATSDAQDVNKAEALDDVEIVFTAHSIPTALADTSRYVEQLHETARLIVNSLGIPNSYDVCYQSRSGSPMTPWLEPDINDHLKALSTKGVKRVVIVPIGFVSDHQEVLYDLDTVALETARQLSISARRAHTVGLAEPFVEMVCELIREELDGTKPRALGELGAVTCQAGQCCPAPVRRPVAPAETVTTVDLRDETRSTTAERPDVDQQERVESQ